MGVLHMFHTYIASVSFGCCICFTHNMQCYICFAMATHVFSSCFRRMLQVFQLFQTYITHVSFRYRKSRSGVAHVVVRLICSSRLLQLLDLPACAWVWIGASGRCRKPCGRRSRWNGAAHGAERIKMPKRGVNWTSLKIKCKN
jgi:hypothetical protein